MSETDLSEKSSFICIRSWENWRTRYTVYPGYNNTRVFFGVIIHEIHRAVQELYGDSSYALTHVLQWHFGVIFPSQDTIRSIILFTMYYFTAINIFLSLHYMEIYKFHNYSIHTITNTAGSCRLGVFHGEPSNSEKRQIHNKH